MICQLGHSATTHQDGDQIKVDIYNSKGQFMETLINKVFYKGNQTIYWQPRVYSSGIYFIQVSDAVTSQNQKIIYLK